MWDTVGGSLGDGYGPHSNSCATRVSHGINHSGTTIPRGAPGANLNFGGDNNGLRYILSARQFEVYLGDAWGAADYTNITHDQFSALSSSLSAGQVAVVVSQDHATVIRSGYSGDNYSILGVGGSAWILPTRSASN
ncbi:T6SS effector amidase Tae4 family protein [Microbulbifer sp. VTAC004]|uniref:T6SS effector amidase Tae4 family protein n=1 Tax=Microbulbifer sp. VTAC004 TaxID=3243386 RepID=UPI0040394AD2